MIDRQEITDLVQQTKKIIINENTPSITVKGAADYVTQVDYDVQEFLRANLTSRYPGIAFISEEQENSRISPAGSCWILDPIDGTTNLIHDYQMSAVSLGLYENGRITLSVVYNPFTEETFTAASGQGATRNRVPIQVSSTASLADSVISYGSSPYHKEAAHEMFRTFERIFINCADFRRSGSAALDLCYVACGRVEAYLERDLKPWDYAAGSLILTEAGGRITDWNGRPLPYLRNSDCLATNGRIEEALAALIA